MTDLDIDNLLATMTTPQLVRFTIYVAREVAPRDVYPKWWQWAKSWLSGEDRSDMAARVRAAWAVECALAADPDLDIKALAAKVVREEQ